MTEETEIREPDTTAIVPEGDATLRDMSVLDLKREARRELHYYLWLRGKTYAEITEITGFNRWTIWQDIKYIQENLPITSRDMDTIRDEALLRMHLDRVEILGRARDAEDKNAWRFYNVIAQLDMKILDRYTQMTGGGGDPALEEKMKIMIDFMIEKLGPESMNAFGDFYKTRLAAKRAAGNA